MIGLSLIKVGIIDFGGGFAAKAAELRQLRTSRRCLLVLIVVIGFNCCRSPLLRMAGLLLPSCRLYRVVMPGYGGFQQYAQFAVNHRPSDICSNTGLVLASISSCSARFDLLACWKPSAISPPLQWFSPPYSGERSVLTERRRAGRWSGFRYRLRCRFITINHVCAK